MVLRWGGRDAETSDSFQPAHRLGAGFPAGDVEGDHIFPHEDVGDPIAVLGSLQGKVRRTGSLPPPVPSGPAPGLPSSTHRPKSTPGGNVLGKAEDIEQRRLLDRDLAGGQRPLLRVHLRTDTPTSLDLKPLYISPCTTFSISLGSWSPPLGSATPLSKTPPSKTRPHTDHAHSRHFPIHQTTPHPQ